MVLYLIGAVAVLAIITTGIWKIHHNGYEKGKAEVQAEWNESVDKQAAAELEQSGTASQNLETQRVQTRVVYRTITRSVDKYIDRPVYRNICFDDDGMRDANAALRKTAPADPAKPDTAVPAADRVGQRAGRDSPPKTD